MKTCTTSNRKALRMNGKRIRVRRNDVIDEAAASGMQLYDTIWAVPGSILDETVKTGLSLKDAAKKAVGLNPWNDDTDARQDLLYNAERSREPQELARIYKYATARGDTELANAVEKRAKNLGILAKVKSGDSPWEFRTFNPRKSRLVHRGKKRKNARRKRNSEAGAAEFYEKFHGAPSTEEIVVEEEIHEHENLGVIGTLQCLAIETPAGLPATIRFEGKADDIPFLASSEDGKQLYIVGGDQTVDLDALGLDGHAVKDRMILGTFAPPRCSECSTVIKKKGEELVSKSCPVCGHKFVTFEDVDEYEEEEDRTWNLGYEASKSFDGFEPVLYLHDLGAPDEGSTDRKFPPMLEYDPINHLLFVSGGEYHVELPMFGTSPGIEN